MSKYLAWLLVFIAATVTGVFMFTAQLGQAGPLFWAWLAIAGFTCMLAGVQWHAYTQANHPERAEALYARFLGMPIAEFEALSSKTRSQVMGELSDAIDDIKARLP